MQRYAAARNFSKLKLINDEIIFYNLGIFVNILIRPTKRVLNLIHLMIFSEIIIQKDSKQALYSQLHYDLIRQ